MGNVFSALYWDAIGFKAIPIVLISNFIAWGAILVPGIVVPILGLVWSFALFIAFILLHFLVLFVAIMVLQAEGLGGFGNNILHVMIGLPIFVMPLAQLAYANKAKKIIEEKKKS